MKRNVAYAAAVLVLAVVGRGPHAGARRARLGLAGYERRGYARARGDPPRAGSRRWPPRRRDRWCGSTDAHRSTFTAHTWQSRWSVVKPVSSTSGVK